MSNEWANKGQVVRQTAALKFPRHHCTHHYLSGLCVSLRPQLLGASSRGIEFQLPEPITKELIERNYLIIRCFTKLSQPRKRSPSRQNSCECKNLSARIHTTANIYTLNLCTQGADVIGVLPPLIQKPTIKTNSMFQTALPASNNRNKVHAPLHETNIEKSKWCFLVPRLHTHTQTYNNVLYDLAQPSYKTNQKRIQLQTTHTKGWILSTRPRCLVQESMLRLYRKKHILLTRQASAYACFAASVNVVVSRKNPHTPTTLQRSIKKSSTHKIVCRTNLYNLKVPGTTCHL